MHEKTDRTGHRRSHSQSLLVDIAEDDDLKSQNNNNEWSNEKKDDEKIECDNNSSNESITSMNTTSDDAAAGVLVDFGDDGDDSGDCSLSEKSKSFDSILNGTLSDSDDDGDSSMSPVDDGDAQPGLEKAASLTKLDAYERRREQLTRQSSTTRRPASLHQDTFMADAKSEDLFASLRLAGRDMLGGGRGGAANSTDELSATSVATTKQPSMLNGLADSSGDMWRRAVSLCELQGKGLKGNLRAKLEQTSKFVSLEQLPVSAEHEDTERWFPRLSAEDCRRCPSCRSRSASYHSLLYDQETAQNFPVYQQTVCDLDQATEQVTTTVAAAEGGDVITATAAPNAGEVRAAAATAKGKLWMKGTATLTSFKDKWTAGRKVGKTT